MALSMCLALVVPAHADTTTPGISFTAKKTIYEPGRDIKVSINLDCEQPLVALGIGLSYDQDALELKEFSDKIQKISDFDIISYDTADSIIMVAFDGHAEQISKVCDVTFTVKEDVPGNANYNITASADSSYTVEGGSQTLFAADDITGLTITPDPANLPEYEFEFVDAEYDYDGEVKTISAYVPNPSEIPEFSYKDAKGRTFEGATDAGEYRITATAVYDGYKNTSKTAVLTINQKAVTVKDVDLENETATIDGVIDADADNVQADFTNAKFEVESSDADGVTLSVTGIGLKGTKAKNYKVTEIEDVVVDADEVRYVKVKAGTNGTVEVAGEEIDETTGEIAIIDGYGLALKAEANTNYKFSGWYVDGKSVSSKAEYVLTFDDLEDAGNSTAEVEAKFTKKQSNDKHPSGNNTGNYYDSIVNAGGGQIAGGSTTGSTQGTTTASKVDFKDLVGDYAWAAEPVNALAAAGILNGRSDDSFDPASYVTRAEFAKMICVAMAIPEAANTALPTFTDVTEDDWFFGWVEAAAAKGIVNGVTENTFAPNDLVTREQMASMLYRAIVSMNYAQMLPSGTATSFADYASIADYAKAAVVELNKAGVINGVTDTMFAPKAPATRAQAAAMIYQYFAAIKAI